MEDGVENVRLERTGRIFQELCILMPTFYGKELEQNGPTPTGARETRDQTERDN